MASHLELKNRHTGEVLRMSRVREASGVNWLRLDGSLPSGCQGPPPHRHYLEDETGTVKAGTLAARVGDQTIQVAAGGTATLPKGVVHNWWNGGSDLLEFSGRVTPVVDLDRFLQAIFAVVNAGPAGKPPIFYLAHILWRHRRTQALASPPMLIQRITFPLIVVLGTLLGRYRGNNWPGSPASCPGAPLEN